MAFSEYCNRGIDAEFVSTRFAEKEKVSLETEKWPQFLEKESLDRFDFAGVIDLYSKKYNDLDGDHFTHPEIKRISKNLLGVTWCERSVTQKNQHFSLANAYWEYLNRTFPLQIPCIKCKNYALENICPHTDLVTCSLIYEGFVDAFLGAVYFMKPIVVNKCFIYSVDIKPKRFKDIEGFVAQKTVRMAMKVMENPIIKLPEDITFTMD